MRRRGNVSGCEDAALRRREVVPHQKLDCRYRGTEGSEVALDESRHDAHQRVPADFTDTAFWKWGQRTERLRLFVAVQTVTRRVQDQDHSPLLRKSQPGDNGRRTAAAALASIDDHTAAFEARYANTGPGAPRQPGRVVGDSQRKAVQCAQRGRHRKRDLRAGPEASMPRYGLLNHQTMAGSDSKVLAQRCQVASRATAFRAFDGGILRTRQRYDGFWFAERQTDAAEAASGLAVRIKEAKMQASGHFYGNGIRHLPPSGCIIHGRLGARTHDSRFHRQGKRARSKGTTYFGSWPSEPGVMEVEMSETTKEKVYSEAEIAEAMGCPVGTVKSLIHRGLARMKEALT